MNRVNPKKLLQSKWTASAPRNREKHWLVTEVRCDDAGVPQTCILQAVHSYREIELDPHTVGAASAATAFPGHRRFLASRSRLKPLLPGGFHWHPGAQDADQQPARQNEHRGNKLVLRPDPQ